MLSYALLVQTATCSVDGCVVQQRGDNFWPHTPLAVAALREAPWIPGSCIIIIRQLGGVSARADAMATATAGQPGGGFDVDRVLDFEKRSGIKDGEIESFITKVDAVNAAIQAMKARRGSRP